MSLLWAHCSSSFPHTSTHTDVVNVDEFVADWVADWAAMPVDLRSMAAMWALVVESIEAVPSEGPPGPTSPLASRTAPATDGMTPTTTMLLRAHA